MAAPFVQRIADFKGVARDVNPAALPPELFYTDEGGDLFERGTWRLRRGRTRVAALPFSNPIDTLFPFETRVGSIALAVIDSAGVFRGYNQEPNTDLVTLAAGVISATFAAGVRCGITEFQRSIYINNGWTRPRRWDGNWARRTDFSGSDELEEVPYMGIEAPPDQATYDSAESASSDPLGPCDVGVRLMRIRWMDSRTGWVSNPNEAIEFTVSGSSKKVTFDIGNNANEIDPPTDPKVDTLIIEWTEVGGGEYFVAVQHLYYLADGTTDGTAVVDISDENLVLEGELPWEDDGHDLPPLKKEFVAHRERIWGIGNQSYGVGTVATTLNDATVTGTGTAFSERAIGNTGAPPIEGTKYFHGSGAGSREFYEIDDYVSGTVIELKRPIGYANASGYAYSIVSPNNVVYFSRISEGRTEPESWPSDHYIEIPTGNGGGGLVAGVGFGDDMLFFSRDGAWRYAYQDDPRDGKAFPVPGRRGVINQRCLVLHDGWVYALDSQGVWVYQGGRPEDLARPIAKIYLGDLDFSQSDEWHGAYYPSIRAIRWYCVRTGDSRPKFYIQLDPLSGKWTTGHEDVAITESVTGRLTLTEALTVLQGDENGHIWRADAGTVNGGGTVHHPTVIAGSTTTVVECTLASLPADGTLRGVPVYRLSTGEVRVIASHTANDFTVSSAFATPPAAGETIWLGRVRGKLRTKTFSPARSGPAGKQVARFFRFFYQPLSSVRRVLVRVYESNSATAKTAWGRAKTPRRGNVSFPGTVSGYAASDWLVDLSDAKGFAEIELGANPINAIAVELEVIEPDTALEIWGMELVGVEGGTL